jgi:hypothetical protein
MADVRRGKDGQPHESEVKVLDPERTINGSYSVLDDTVIEVEVYHGETVTIRLSQKEELEFLAALARRMEMRVNPPLEGSLQRPSKPLPPENPFG